MFSGNSIESVVKAIFPLGMYEFEGSENKELLTSYIEIVLKRIHKSSQKDPVRLYNKIKEECENIVTELKEELTTNKAKQFFKKNISITHFKNEIGLFELYKKKEHGRRLTSSGVQKLQSFATKLKSPGNIFELIELQMNLEEIIPYGYKYPGVVLDEEGIGRAAIASSPILSVRDELKHKIRPIIYNYDHDAGYDGYIGELYDDLLALVYIKELILNNIFALMKPTKGIVNGGFFPMAFFVALGYSFVGGAFSLRNFIYAFIAVFVILVVKDLLFPKN